MAEDGSLVLSCWYRRFSRAEPEVLRYEDDLAGDNTPSAAVMRQHLAAALAQELDVRLIVAVEAREPDPAKPNVRPSRPTFHARRDLLGRIVRFDGQRFVVDFRRPPSA